MLLKLKTLCLVFQFSVPFSWQVSKTITIQGHAALAA